MTAPDPRLGEIEALVDGLTDLCPEYMRQGIRHLQRNCDIDCNTHESENTWMDCKQPDRYDGERMAQALASIPYLLAELRKAQDALGDLLYVADHKAADTQVGQWWAEVIRGPIIRRLGDDGATRLRAAVAAATGGGE